MGFALAAPDPRNGYAPANEDFTQSPSNSREASGIMVHSSKATVPEQRMVRWATKGRPIDFADSTSSTKIVACETEINLLHSVVLGSGESIDCKSAYTDSIPVVVSNT